MKLGIIKGGQLGKMLIEASSAYPVSTRVMDTSEDAPCRSLCDEFVLGDPGDFDAVYSFGKKCDILTFEYEHVNVEALEKLEREGITVYPKPQTLKIIQDKGLQKTFYAENGIPTADFVLVEAGEDVRGRAGYIPGVLKSRTHGYDGKGVVKLSASSLDQGTARVPSVLEKMIDFEKEISLIVARNDLGQSSVYPAVEMRSDPDKNMLDFLFSPADIPESVRRRSEAIALKIAERLDLVGILAVEMFVTRDGDVLVNEAAPRPHNTGHHTIEANRTSQFEQHLRVVLGLPPGDAKAKSAAAMVNLVGAEGYRGVPRFEGLEGLSPENGYFLHDYGKKETKPFRKMGHITVLDDDIEKAKEKAKWIKEKARVTA